MSKRDRRLSENQYQGLIKANDPSSVNQYLTKADLGGGGLGYTSYIAILDQSASSPPVPIILKNDLGEVPVWGYTSIGKFTLTSTGKFTVGKTVIFGVQNGSPISDASGLRNTFATVHTDVNTISIETGNCDASGVSTLGNGILYTEYSFIEVRVYD